MSPRKTNERRGGSSRAGATGYVAFGLRILSELPLPELIVAGDGAGAPDVELRLAAPSPDSASSPWVLPPADPLGGEPVTPGAFPFRVRSDAHGEFVDFSLPDVGRVVVRRASADGVTRVIIDRAPLATDDTLRMLSVGPIMATILFLRGWLALHGSAVELAGGAVAILGTSGSGKSTTAAALSARGYRVVADDLVAIPEASPDVPVTVVPAFPQVRLWPDSAAALVAGGESLPRLTATEDKRVHDVRGHFASAPLPLRAIYILGPAAVHEAVLLKPADAFIELVRNAYGARTFESADRERRFGQIARVARSVPVRLLRVKRGFEYLPEVVELIASTL